MTAAQEVLRPRLVRRSRYLNYATLGYNSLEGVIAIGAGVMAGSNALVGFGLDSVIELSAGIVALWRLSAELDPERRERAEYLSLRLIGVSFLALALYVGADAVTTLIAARAPRHSWLGIVLAATSLAIMPMLASAKRFVALQLESGALAAEARQTLICTYLSALLLAGLGLNALLGWWWADPAAALAMVPFIAKEGIEGLRGHSDCAD